MEPAGAETLRNGHVRDATHRAGKQRKISGAARARKICWCRRADSNRQPIAYEAIALPLSYCGVQKEFVSNFYQTSRPQLKRRNQRSPIGPRFFSMDARVKPGHDEED
jgi:hypothetical protein